MEMKSEDNGHLKEEFEQACGMYLDRLLEVNALIQEEKVKNEEQDKSTEVRR